MITKENKDKAIAKVARNKADVGSPEVQVSILTERIKEVTEHVKANKHDFMAKRGLMQMVGKRKKLLKYLSYIRRLLRSSASENSFKKRKNPPHRGGFLWYTGISIAD